MTWRTRLDHAAIPPGHELHGVFLEPIGDEGGPRSTVCIQIPETTAVEVQHAFETAARFQMRVVITPTPPSRPPNSPASARASCRCTAASPSSAPRPMRSGRCHERGERGRVLTNRPLPMQGRAMSALPPTSDIGVG